MLYMSTGIAWVVVHPKKVSTCALFSSSSSVTGIATTGLAVGSFRYGYHEDEGEEISKEMLC